MKKFLPLSAILILLSACSKEKIQTIEDPKSIEEQISHGLSTNEQDLLFEELDSDLIRAESEIVQSRGILDIEFPLNQWDFIGAAYVTSLEETNSINQSLQGDVNSEILTNYFNIVNQQFLINLPDQEQLITENNVNEFELNILRKYSQVLSAVTNPHALVVLNKVFERFVIRNVSNEQRQQRLLTYFSLRRHISSFFYTNGIIVNGQQIFNSEDILIGINPDVVNDVLDCMHGYAEDWTDLEWFGWGIALAPCMSAMIVDCYNTITTVAG